MICKRYGGGGAVKDQKTQKGLWVSKLDRAVLECRNSGRELECREVSGQERLVPSPSSKIQIGSRILDFP